MQISTLNASRGKLVEGASSLKPHTHKLTETPPNQAKRTKRSIYSISYRTLNTERPSTELYYGEALTTRTAPTPQRTSAGRRCGENSKLLKIRNWASARACTTRPFSVRIRWKLIVANVPGLLRRRRRSARSTCDTTAVVVVVAD